MIHYCDDFVCCFQNRYEVEGFKKKLKERLGEYGLELAEEKKRILEFGRFASRNRKARGEGKPDTFDFLAFWMLFRWPNRRSQKRSYTIDTFFNGLLRTFPLLEPSINVSLFYR